MPAGRRAAAKSSSIRQTKAVPRGRSKAVIEISSDSSQEKKMGKSAVKRGRSESSSADGDDEISIVEVPSSSVSTNRIKVEPPSPETLEFKELHPVTFARDVVKKSNIVSQTSISCVNPSSAKRVKVERPSPGTEMYKSLPSVVLPKYIPKTRSGQKLAFGSTSASTATTSKTRAAKVAPKYIESSAEEISEDSADGDDEISQDGDDESVDAKLTLNSTKGSESGEKSDMDEDPVSDSHDNKGKSVVKVEPKKAKEKEKTVHLEDLQRRRFVQDTNEDPKLAVMQKSLQDDCIESTYKNLPWVRPAKFRPWGEPPPENTTAPGLIWFSAWQSYLEPYDERKLFKWLTFQKAGRYINLSRVDPEDVSVSDGYGGSQRYLIQPGIGYNYCVATSLIYVHECAVMNPKPVKETYVKKVGGVLHSQEMERMMGCLGMLYDFSIAKANMFGWILYFDTRREDYQSMPASPIKGNWPGSSKTGVSFFRPDKKPDFKPSFGEKISLASSSKVNTFLKPVLNFSDNIPIYDGRYENFDPNKDMDRISELPLWKDGQEDAPRQSLAVVGYTVHTFTTKKDQAVNISLNLQWVIVLGTTDDN